MSFFLPAGHFYQKNRMQRSVPGTQEVAGREFMYLESTDDETFHQLLNSISSVVPSVAVPRFGGVIEENIRINLKKRISFIGISYRGDIEG